MPGTIHPFHFPSHPRRRYYLAADTSLFFLYKWIRDDFVYHFPIESTFGTYLTAFGLRLLIKNIANFTCLVQFRISTELGGLLWTLNTFFAVATSFVCVGLYYSRDLMTCAEVLDLLNGTAREAGGEIRLDDDIVVSHDCVVVSKGSAWLMLNMLSMFWLFTFSLFFATMKPQVRRPREQGGWGGGGRGRGTERVDEQRCSCSDNSSCACDRALVRHRRPQGG